MLNEDSSVFINDDQVLVLKANEILSQKRTNRILCTVGLSDNKSVIVVGISTPENEQVFTYLDEKSATEFAKQLLDASLKSTSCHSFERVKIDTLYLKKEVVAIDQCDISKVEGFFSSGVNVSIHKSSFPVKDNRVLSCVLSPNQAVSLVSMIQVAIEKLVNDDMTNYQ